MRTMNAGAFIPSPPGAGIGSAYGLPKVSYHPPVVATSAAALLLFLVAALIGGIGVLNAISQLTTVAPDGETSLTVGGALCGVTGLFILLAAYYFLTAVIKGVRDLGTNMHYTRGMVAPKRNMDERRSASWLVVAPSYVGTDVASASAVNEEQRSASVDRSQIFQPRFNPAPQRTSGRQGEEAEAATANATAVAQSTHEGAYLSRERISLRQEVPNPEVEGGSPTPHIAFRVDFASRTNIQPGEDVLVAHSPYLQHVYYIARLQNGEWKVHRNKALI
jgi:hypothetical protein